MQFKRNFLCAVRYAAAEQAVVMIAVRISVPDDVIDQIARVVSRSDFPFISRHDSPAGRWYAVFANVVANRSHTRDVGHIMSMFSF